MRLSMCVCARACEYVCFVVCFVVCVCVFFSPFYFYFIRWSDHFISWDIWPHMRTPIIYILIWVDEVFHLSQPLHLIPSPFRLLRDFLRALNSVVYQKCIAIDETQKKKKKLETSNNKCQSICIRRRSVWEFYRVLFFASSFRVRFGGRLRRWIQFTHPISSRAINFTISLNSHHRCRF